MLQSHVVNMYFEYLNSTRPGCLFITTFFYAKLLGSSRTCTGTDYNYARVSAWGQKFRKNMFECSLIFIPINIPEACHWCLAVIDVKNQRVGYYDSFGGRNDACIHNLKRYIVDEAKHVHGKHVDLSTWTSSHIPGPQQTNGFDCGMFMCKAADYLSDGLSMDFVENDMVLFRKRLLLDILNDKS